MRAAILTRLARPTTPSTDCGIGRWQGFDPGVLIANINDGFLGAAPDVGAAEAGAPAMKFGIEASSGSSVSGTPAPIPTPTPTPTPTPAPPGTANTSSSMDSSSYTINAGQSVTFTASIMGNLGTPTGTVTFRDNGAAITSCISMPVTNGNATCTTASLAAGTHPITGLYSGDAVYGAGVAGPITQTVKGVVATKLTIDSSRYTSTAGQNVTFTVTVTGGSGTPTGAVNFQDNGSSIAGKTRK